MILKELKLKNFRGIAKTTIKFHPKMNVIIGINGSAKTTILDAMALLMARTLPLFNEKPRFDKKDIMAKKTSAKIELKFKSKLYNQKGMSNVSCEGFINEETEYTIDFEDNKNEITKTMIEGGIVDNAPLIAYYPTSRAVLEVSIKASNESTFHQIDAYDNCLTGHSNFNALFDWYRNTDDIHNDDGVKELIHRTDKITYEFICKENELIEKLMPKANKSDKKRYELIHEENERNKKRYELIHEENELMAKINERTREVRRIKNPLLQFTEKAILECTGFTSLKLDRINNEFLVEKNDVTLDINMLSHGEKIYIALVGDIARRLTMLNPNLENPLEGNGVILIDEVELHLHPEWQTSILGKLQNIFPNCQFIITTHSPQVLHAIKAEQIFISLDFEVSKPSDEVYGKTSNQILEYFMETKKRDDKVQNQIDHIYSLFDDKEYEESRKFLNELEDKMIEDPEITRLNHILNRFSKPSPTK